MCYNIVCFKSTGLFLKIPPHLFIEKSKENPLFFAAFLCQDVSNHCSKFIF